MKQELLENWMTLLEHEALANKHIGLATVALLEKRKAIWAILAMVHWEVKYKNRRRYRVELSEEEEAFLEALEQLLIEHLSEETARELLKAARILDFTRTQSIGIGNADAQGYERDCVLYWQAFEPYVAYFQDALLVSTTWMHHWVIIGQVLWAHFRWTSTKDYDATFSLEAAHFFIKESLQLPLSTPIHYYDFWEVAPHNYYTGNDYKQDEGKLAVLQSNFGVLYYYYAQILHYHFSDYTTARTYYHKFIAAEPNLLPDNNYELFWVSKEKRMYPPCIQAAYTEIARTYEAVEDRSSAMEFYQKAIAQRPENHQAPYENIALLYEQNNELERALEYYQKKLAVCKQAKFKYFLYSYATHPIAYFSYAPDQRDRLVPLSNSGFYKYGAVEVVWLLDLAKKIADIALWELEDYALAQRCYKTCNWFMEPNTRTRWHHKSKADLETLQLSIWENQALIAFELKDYWQARSLYKKILKVNAKDVTAKRALQQIRNQLGY